MKSNRVSIPMITISYIFEIFVIHVPKKNLNNFSTTKENTTVVKTLSNLIQISNKLSWGLMVTVKTRDNLTLVTRCLEYRPR